MAITRFKFLSPTLQGTCLVALSAIMYGVLGYFGTLLLHKHFSISAMLFWRFFIATIWIVGVLFLSRKKVAFKQIPFSLMSLAVLMYLGSSSFYFVASQSIGTGIGMVIFFSYPVFVALLAFLFSRSKFDKFSLLSLGFLILGLILLKGNGNQSINLLGLIFAFTASLCYAIYVFQSQPMAKEIDTTLQTLFVCAGNSLLFLLTAFYTQTFQVPVDLNSWLEVITLGVIATALPIQLLLEGLKYISSLKASIISVLEPVVTVLIGIVLLNESITIIQMIGIVIILSGALLIQFALEETKE